MNIGETHHLSRMFWLRDVGSLRTLGEKQDEKRCYSDTAEKNITSTIHTLSTPFSLLDRVLISRTIVNTEGLLKVWFSDELDEPLLVMDKILVWIEPMIDKNLPPLSVEASSFWTMKFVLNTARHETNLTRTRSYRSLLPLMELPEERLTHSSVDRFVYFPDASPGNVMICAS